MDYLSLAFVLIVIGVILLAAEVLIPTGGLLIVAALLFFAVAVGTIIAYGDTMEAALAVGGLAVGLPGVGFLMVSAWRRLALGGSLDPEYGEDRANALPQVQELKYLRGRFGRTVSPMRPSGTVVFDGRRVDAMTEGIMLEPGVWVKCMDVKGGKILVRQMDPKDTADIHPQEEPKPEEPAAPEPTPKPNPDDFDLGFELPPK